MKIIAALTTLLMSASLAGLPVRGGDPTTYVQAGPLEVSNGAVAHIVNHETGGVGYYTKFCARPSDPGFASGVTVGFGYDLRYHTRDQVRKDWAGVATPAEIEAMVSVVGMDGAVYRRIRDRVHISWDEGIDVFRRVTLPRWGQLTYDAYQLEKIKDVQLHPHVAGALVGNTFNRGTAISTSNRYIEKYRRRQYLLSRQFSKVPQTYLDERRHWPNHAGLKRRRTEEADLTKLGLQYTWWYK